MSDDTTEVGATSRCRRCDEPIEFVDSWEAPVWVHRGRHGKWPGWCDPKLCYAEPFPNARAEDAHPSGCHIIEVKPGEWRWLIFISCPEVHVSRYDAPSDDADAMPPKLREWCKQKEAEFQKRMDEVLDRLFADIEPPCSHENRCRRCRGAVATSEMCDEGRQDVKERHAHVRGLGARRDMSLDLGHTKPIEWKHSGRVSIDPNTEKE